MEAKKVYEFWLQDDYFDETAKKELLAIENDEKEIEERFYKDLEFGTGGLRGIIGMGTNRINIYTVRKATQGLANFILKEKGQDRGVAIAYDSRNMSVEFAREAALCFCANGIKVYVFDSLRPTPELSFALRQLNCIAGVVITASHNPPEYNGYKVYWEDGAQITFPKDKEIIAEVQAITDYKMVKSIDMETALSNHLYHTIGEEIDTAYMEALKELVLDPDIILSQSKNIRIVYTPIHGSGNLPVRRILNELGFEHVYVVEEQEKPDGNFPTVAYPNPEDPNVFTLGLKLAKEVNADIILATDPDADRLGVYVKDEKTGKYMPLTGNMSGILICEHQLSRKKEKGILPANGAVVTTVVSGKMIQPIAKEYNIKVIETLTGFKYIGEQIKFFEQNNNYEYLFGYEESYGCLLGTHARDKDAVVAVMALCEAAAYYKSKDITLWEQMLSLFEKYGYYKEELYTLTLKGKEGADKILSIMKQLKSNPMKQLGHYNVIKFRDYSEDKIVDFTAKETKPTGLPFSNVLYFEMEDDAWCCVRPSGTEPKIKFYMGVKGSDAADADIKLDELREAVLKLV